MRSYSARAWFLIVIVCCWLLALLVFGWPAAQMWWLMPEPARLANVLFPWTLGFFFFAVETACRPAFPRD